ncbi:MAG: tetratricopeptide repeat protein [Vampirovibrionales bacterium]|nr:tetratricopeptide repeat protein [Vampirovibrionales bacterium]
MSFPHHSGSRFNDRLLGYCPKGTRQTASGQSKKRHSKQLAGIVLASLTALSITAFPSFLPQSFAQYSAGDYGYYFEKGSDYYNKSQVTNAIEMFKKALPLATEDNIPAIYNNLGAAHIKRGLYYQNSLRNYNAALSDYRNALFYLDTAWPENVSKRPIHQRNYDVTVQNLDSVYSALNLNTKDKATHLSQAQQSRLKGNLQEAIVEYAQALKLDSKNAEAAKALGDLFNVVNLPLKSQKYYQLAGNLLGDEASDDLFIQQAAVAYKAGNVDKAVQLYNKALETNPQNTAALDQLEKIWLNEIKFNNASVLGHANLASVYQKKKMYEQALAQYQAAEHFAEMNRATPFDVKKQIRLNMGTLYQEKKQYQLADAAYNTVLQTDPNNLQALTYKASMLQEVGKGDEAGDLYQRILTADPNNAMAQQALFDLASAEQDPEKSAVALKNYADRFSGNPDIQARVGEEFHRRKDYDNAALFYQRALRLNPSLAAAYANLGAVYQAQGKAPESVEAYRQAVKLESGNATFKKLLADAEQNIGAESFQKAADLQQQGKHSEAVPYFTQALAQTPNDPDLLAAYGVTLQNLNRLDEAIARYQKAITFKPNEASYHYYLGTAYHQKGQLPLASQAYQKAVQLDPGQNDVRQALASLQQQEGGQALEQAIDAYNRKQYPQALIAVNKALARNKGDAMAHYYKGLILQAQKNPVGAKNSYKEATLINPDFADAYYALAVIMDEMKDVTGAKTAYRRFVELSGDRDDEFVQYAKERLTAISSP